MLRDDVAAWIAGAVVGLAGAWKLFMHARRDQRADQSGAEQQGGYSVLVGELRDEVDRLSKLMREMGTRLDVEIAKRREVEAENHALKLRVAHLEIVVTSLGGTI